MAAFQSTHHLNPQTPHVPSPSSNTDHPHSPDPSFITQYPVFALTIPHPTSTQFHSHRASTPVSHFIQASSTLSSSSPPNSVHACCVHNRLLLAFLRIHGCSNTQDTKVTVKHLRTIQLHRCACIHITPIQPSRTPSQSFVLAIITGRTKSMIRLQTSSKIISRVQTNPHPFNPIILPAQLNTTSYRRMHQSSSFSLSNRSFIPIHPLYYNLPSLPLPPSEHQRERRIPFALCPSHYCS